MPPCNDVQAACPVLFGLNQSLTNFVLGMRGKLCDGPLGLALTAYTDTSVSSLPRNAPAAKARFERDGPAAKGEAERRVDPSDGCSYTREEFRDFYKARWEERWSRAQPPTGAEDKRKLSAILFLNDCAGAQLTVLPFDEAAGTFRALSLPAKADTLLLYRTDRVLYRVAPTVHDERHTMRVHFLGHYT